MSQCSYIYVSWFWSCCSLYRFSIFEDQQTCSSFLLQRDRNMIYFFIFLLIWQKQKKPLCVDMQVQTSRGILINTCSKHMQRIQTRGSLLECSIVNFLHFISITPLIALPCFPLLNCKRELEVLWIPQWYFGIYTTRSFKHWNI